MGEMKISTTKLQFRLWISRPEGIGWKSNEVAADPEENLQMKLNKRGFCDVASLIIVGEE
jgi:hypothetical protein